VISDVRPDIQTDRTLAHMGKHAAFQTPQLLKVKTTIQQDLLADEVVKKDCHARAHGTALPRHMTQMRLYD
jgi:hypothetical protein